MTTRMARTAARDLVARLPGRRRRRRRLPLIAAGLLVGAVTVIGVMAWWMHRHGADPDIPGHDVRDDAFDRAALDRAADEGMSPARPVDVAVPRSNGSAGGPPVIGELV